MLKSMARGRRLISRDLLMSKPPGHLTFENLRPLWSLRISSRSQMVYTSLPSGKKICCDRLGFNLMLPPFDAFLSRDSLIQRAQPRQTKSYRSGAKWRSLRYCVNQGLTILWDTLITESEVWRFQSKKRFKSCAI